MMYNYGLVILAVVVGIVVVVLLFGIVLLFMWATWRRGNRFTTGAETPDRPQTAREILDQRYARGEITREQYEQMKQDLER